MLTEAGKYGKLYFAQSEKQSRVSTLTAAQLSDWWSDIDNKELLLELLHLSGGYDIHSFFCVFA